MDFGGGNPEESQRLLSRYAELQHRSLRELTRAMQTPGAHAAVEPDDADGDILTRRFASEL
eukprot:3687887-Prymnesium_polylepis.1